MNSRPFHWSHNFEDGRRTCINPAERLRESLVEVLRKEMSFSRVRQGKAYHPPEIAYIQRQVGGAGRYRYRPRPT